jgi:hypothetical protein
MSGPPADVVARAETFVWAEAGFAQVTTLDDHGYPVCRSMTAFLVDGFVVELVQRRVHRRLVQLAANPRLLVTWVGTPAPEATNERPHVFDLGRLPSRAVMVRGTGELMDDDWTWRVYARHHADHLARGQDGAPDRDRAQVAADLVGLRVDPYRVRLEGFGAGAQSFDWRVGRPLDRPPHQDRPASQGAP